MSQNSEERSASAELVAYYRRRAAEYEAIYSWPERQADLARLREKIPAMLRGARVLRTDRDGAVTFTSDGQAWHVLGFTERRQ